ncbi:MAG: squalene/phytoene synthase family protein [Halanaerobiaceae bacterium]|nr:squalene/phytoene synthase family protein [Halanaerobiaceae bacterium]
MSEKAVSFCKKILPGVSRSFALSIPMLDEIMRVPVTIIYLQDRLLDSFEDEISDKDISMERRKEMMDQVVELFRPDNYHAEKTAAEITSFAEFMPVDPLKEMVANAVLLREAYDSLEDFVKEVSYKWLSEMNLGMKKYLSKEINTFLDLDEYCYYVAGTVGGFLTDLLVYYSYVSERDYDILLANYNTSGQFLQKVNLIRDIREDIKTKKKHYWPLKSLNITIDGLLEESNEEKGMLALEKMISDVKTHIPGLLHYYNSIPLEMPGYRNFYSLNNVLGLATIEEMEGNPAVLYGNEPVKVGKLTFLNIMKNPEKSFLEKIEKYNG